MIKFIDLSEELPYLTFREKYYEALTEGQSNIEAMAISTFNKEIDEVDSRYVNLKFIEGKKFIFFTNYNSPKAHAFETHDQIAISLFWSKTNTQIRLKAKIKKTSVSYNNKYFKKRALDKNALAISSRQSKRTSSYESVINNFNKTKKQGELRICPDYWGGYYFIPYYFEFWEGHPSRLNIRSAYVKVDEIWKNFILEP